MQTVSSCNFVLCCSHFHYFNKGNDISGANENSGVNDNKNRSLMRYIH